MWLLLAFLSAALLGFYDVSKKEALRDNPVVPVLMLNTFFCSLIFMPLVALSAAGVIAETSLFYVPLCGWAVHKYIFLKALIVLASWLCGYYAMKNLPLTLVGPINATRPVMVLLGAIVVFGERLNVYQWVGVLLAIVGYYMLRRSGKKEGIDFRHNRWIALAVVGAVFGAVSALYDKFLLAPAGEGGVGLDRMAVQSYFMLYQFLMLAVFWGIKTHPLTPPVREGSGCAVKLDEEPLTGGGLAQPSSEARLSPSRGSGERVFGEIVFGVLSRSFFWILLVSLFLSAADFVYFYALSLPDALISVVSMIRRGSVLVSFGVGALVFREKNLRSKAVDLALVLLSMVFLYLGSR